MVLLALVAVKSLGDAFVAGSFGSQLAISVILNFVIAVAAYFGLWKADPGGVTTLARNSLNKD